MVLLILLWQLPLLLDFAGDEGCGAEEGKRKQKWGPKGTSAFEVVGHALNQSRVVQERGPLDWDLGPRPK